MKYKSILFLSVFLTVLINPGFLLADSSNEDSESRLNLAHFPSAFGLEAHNGDVDIRQARVFIPSAGGKKRRATENSMSFEFAVSDDFMINAAKRFSTLSGTTSVIKLESTSFGARYKILSKPDEESEGFHRDLYALAFGIHFDTITADPFIIDEVPILLHDSHTWGAYLAYAQKLKGYSEIHYLLGYARNKMAAGRGQCVYAGIGYLNDPMESNFRWGGSGKLFKDFAGWHITSLIEGICNISDGLNLELELGLTISGTPMARAYFSDAAAISMNFSRESSFQNVKNRTFPYAVLALKYNF